ncbi:MAG: roadblock/LC7 domain-containing protein [Nitrospiraceae bacterium]|nr:roadblock/LC7 domain-containing protein [Nitrospiraceae bacterium]
MISETLKAHFGNHLAALCASCDAADMVMVATLDGRLVAEQQRKNHHGERAAVMSSSLMALGDAIAKELSLGTCQIIISENDKGIVLFKHIAQDFVLVCLTESSGGLGALLSWTKRSAEDMASSVPAAAA